MIPSFEPLEQSTITLLRERDLLVKRYRAFFALLDWGAKDTPLREDGSLDV